MNSDLIVMTFPSMDSAGRAWRATGMLRDRRTLGLEYVAVVTKADRGEPILHHFRRLPVHPHRSEQLMLERLADELFGQPPQEASANLAAAGMDRRFVARVTEAMASNSSALMIYVPYESVADVEQLAEVLALLEGTVHRTTLPSQVEEALLLQGDRD